MQPSAGVRGAAQAFGLASIAMAAALATACGEPFGAGGSATLEASRPGDGATPSPSLAIAQTIRRAILTDEAIDTPPERIRVTASDASVTLRGDVVDDDDRTRIAAVARRLAGEAVVIDELRVQPPAHVAGLTDPSRPPAGEND